VIDIAESNVCAVVVTFNRNDKLKECLACKQTRPVSA
jgi:hypothetical protein